ncbi:hypothetical protein BSFA1_79980 (plasmid) [Burkholderia sp. SFA1]|nr:hypothetical protein BYI23_E001020 [Burkholderia sp. YI23]BBQ02870.1 hypothetical protein BSFA1_79980 [Burkholderia sp. SFA1]
MIQISVPSPEDRLTVAMYLAARDWLLANDSDAARILTWSRREVAPPQTPEDMAREIVWIILCAGRSAQAARTIEAKVWRAMESGEPVVAAFGYRAKAAAIERAWFDRDRDFVALQGVVATGDPEALIAWCKTLPFVGDDTKYQLAKNFGADVCKPDIWLCRLAGIPDKPRYPIKMRFPACMDLCRMLARATNDRAAAVDSLLWLACNKGVLVTDAQASPITLNNNPPRMRSIYESSADGTKDATSRQSQLALDL